MAERNILFVDGDQQVINGVKRSLRRQRDQWGLFFATSGDEALALMEQTSIDLVVTDMMLPGMKGDQLLRKVTQLYPSIVRIILSGYDNEDSIKNVFDLAHQYLSKPCSPELLKETIFQVFETQQCLKNPQIIASIGDMNQLPSMPTVYQELKKEVNSENSTSRSVAKIFAQDMALSVKLLKLVNSSYFGLSRNISKLEDAVSIIGIKKVSSLVLKSFVEDSFKIENKNHLVYLDYFSKDSIRVAEMAKMISLKENQGEDVPDHAYLGGLLHNIGLLIFMSKMPEKFETLIKEMQQQDSNVFQLERQIFGFTRSEASAYILGLWKMPPRVIESILFQHAPIECDFDDSSALTSVHVAASLLKPPETLAGANMFDIPLDKEYLEKIERLDKLPQWEKLAEKIVNKYS